jgi:hypothetical protein
MVWLLIINHMPPESVSILQRMEQNKAGSIIILETINHLTTEKKKQLAGHTTDKHVQLQHYQGPRYLLVGA